MKHTVVVMLKIDGFIHETVGEPFKDVPDENLPRLKERLRVAVNGVKD